VNRRSRRVRLTIVWSALASLTLLPSINLRAAAQGSQSDSVRRDSVRRDSLTRDSLRRDSARADSLLRQSTLADGLRRDSLARAAESAVENQRIVRVGSIAGLLIFGSATALFLIMLFYSMVINVPVQIETHWGGFGGGMGGWRLSPTLAYLVAALVFGGLFTTTLLVLRDPGPSPSTRGTSAATSEKGSDDAKNEK
jgi:hypothetical protein